MWFLNSSDLCDILKYHIKCYFTYYFTFICFTELKAGLLVQWNLAEIKN